MLQYLNFLLFFLFCFVIFASVRQCPSNFSKWGTFEGQLFKARDILIWVSKCTLLVCQIHNKNKNCTNSTSNNLYLGTQTDSTTHAYACCMYFVSNFSIKKKKNLTVLWFKHSINYDVNWIWYCHYFIWYLY